MGSWTSDSKSHVAHMQSGDFYGSEQSCILEKACSVRIEFIDSSGNAQALKEELPLLEGEVIDASVMSRNALRSFLAEQLDDAREQGVLFSLHMKATMMKVRPHYFWALWTYLGRFTRRHGDTLSAGFNSNNGLNDFYRALDSLESEKRGAIRTRLEEILQDRPPWPWSTRTKELPIFMSQRCHHDASMPAMIRTSGQMWGPTAIPPTPKRSSRPQLAGVYQATIDFCKTNGAFDVPPMGNAANVA